jgi:CPA1 family monovalent cation:H+ antiporter
LLLGAILSPTDPVAVLGLFRQLKVNEHLSTIIEGESLFNDGIAGSLYQIFLAITLLAVHGQPAYGIQEWINGLGQFVLEAGGGILLGGTFGFAISFFVRYLDDALIETTITIVTAYGVYLLADTLHTSAILAVIVAALVLGSYGRSHGMSERTRESVDNFWSIIAFLANALLFLLVGAQLDPTAFFSSQPMALKTLLISLFAILVVLLARCVLVLALTVRSLGPSFHTTITASWRLILFWSGLRGALSLALVLALPLEIPSRTVLIVSTYAVVFFTLLVQGLSLRWVLPRVLPAAKAENSGEQG